MLLTCVTVIQLVDEIIQVKVKVIVRLEKEDASAVEVILSVAPTHIIRCGVYPEKLCTYIDVIRKGRVGIWIVILEGVKVENIRHGVQYVLSEGLVEWKRLQTS
jgi:sorbitol-specific phosphotransferase system component IIBC